MRCARETLADASRVSVSAAPKGLVIQRCAVLRKRPRPPTRWRWRREFVRSVRGIAHAPAHQFEQFSTRAEISGGGVPVSFGLMPISSRRSGAETARRSDTSRSAPAAGGSRCGRPRLAVIDQCRLDRPLAAEQGSCPSGAADDGQNSPAATQRDVATATTAAAAKFLRRSHRQSGRGRLRAGPRSVAISTATLIADKWPGRDASAREHGLQLHQNVTSRARKCPRDQAPFGDRSGTARPPPYPDSHNPRRGYAKRA